MRDGQDENKVEIKILSTTVFLRRAQDTFYKLCREKVSRATEEATTGNCVLHGSDFFRRQKQLGC